MPEIDHALRARLLDPEAHPGTVPLESGRLRCRPEEFIVEEMPAYQPDGREEAHLLLTMSCRSMNTDFALREVSRQLGITASEIGCAGLKDRHALTTQWISLPWRAGDALAAFRHDEIQLGEARPHGNKLRRGHLRGNRFRLVLRDPSPEAEVALPALEQRLTDMIERGGMANAYGQQRFGHEGRNLERGIQLLESRGRIRPGDLMLSALQSALFNLQLLLRRDEGMEFLVSRGDLLRKRDSGGLFPCEDPELDQQRHDAGEIDITASMPGSRHRLPEAGSLAASLEHRACELLGLELTDFRGLGKKAPGSHRPLRVLPEGLSCGAEAASGELGPGIWLSFQLPAGSFATRLLRECVTQWDERRPTREAEQ